MRYGDNAPTRCSPYFAAGTPVEMSETEKLEYKRAALQILSSILGELVPDFWKTLIDQWEQEGRPGPSPVNTPSTNSQKWPLSGYRRERLCTDCNVAWHALSRPPKIGPYVRVAGIVDLVRQAASSCPLIDAIAASKYTAVNIPSTSPCGVCTEPL